MNDDVSPVRSRALSLLAVVIALAIEGAAFATCLFGFSSMASATVIDSPAIMFAGIFQ